jgi:broad specificity phosphatase PhoE
MQTRLLLIRHGASQHKVDRIVGGPCGCRGLTAEGRLQAERVACRLTDDLAGAPVSVYASVIPRAIETAAIIAARLGDLAVTQECGLCSWHTPDYADGEPWSAYQQTHRLPGGGVFRPFERGNESWSELVGRTGRALEQLAAQHVGQIVVVVAHAETIRSSLIIFGGLPLDPGFEMEVAPTSITEWFTEGDPDAWPRPRWTLVRFNDSAHIQAMESQRPHQPHQQPEPQAD